MLTIVACYLLEEIPKFCLESYRKNESTFSETYLGKIMFLYFLGGIYYRVTDKALEYVNCRASTPWMGLFLLFRTYNNLFLNLESQI